MAAVDDRAELLRLLSTCKGLGPTKLRTIAADWQPGVSLEYSLRSLTKPMRRAAVEHVQELLAVRAGARAGPAAPLAQPPPAAGPSSTTSATVDDDNAALALARRGASRGARARPKARDDDARHHGLLDDERVVMRDGAYVFSAARGGRRTLYSAARRASQS
jgi:hypothetical protein